MTKHGSDNLSVVKHSPDLQVVKETDDEHNGDREEPEADTLETDHLLQLHVVLVDGHAVDLPLLHLLEHFVQVLHRCVNLATVFCLRDVRHIRQLNAFKVHDVEVLGLV